MKGKKPESGSSKVTTGKIESMHFAGARGRSTRTLGRNFKRQRGEPVTEERRGVSEGEAGGRLLGDIERREKLIRIKKKRSRGEGKHDPREDGR